jgi:alkane 1-monooxygenase
MTKYIKHYFSIFLAFLFMAATLNGTYFPTIFFISFSTIIIVGDSIIKRDKNLQLFKYPFFLDLSIYLALPTVFILTFFIVSLFSNNLPLWYISGFQNIFNIDFIQLQQSFNSVDKISIIITTFLICGSMSIAGGHELAHRKKNKVDLFIGNWLLAFSFDCNFAIEHVYGHHKNVCLPEDPASAKRGENIYAFMMKGIINEHLSGWEIELNRLKRKKIGFFTFENKIIKGYLRSVIITLLSLGLFGLIGMLIFLLISFLSKASLEAINYIEHYGLVRERGKPVRMRHSWNSNHFFSSIYLYNVTRHSDHHRNSNLKFWELQPIDKDAPMLPYGYLTMLFVAVLSPYLYKKIMKKELENWDQNFANDFERNLFKSLKA